MALSWKWLGGYHAVRNVLVMLLIYNMTCVLTFATIYHTSGFTKHFNVPDDMEPTFANCLYYSFATQSTCMAGEVTPRTTYGRGVLSFQLLSAYLTTLVLIVPWIKASTRRA